MQRLWVTLCLPVDVELEANIPVAQTALDEAWERVIDANGPPEGLVEHVSLEQPVLINNLLVGEATTRQEVRVGEAAEGQEAEEGQAGGVRREEAA